MTGFSRVLFRHLLAVSLQWLFVIGWALARSPIAPVNSEHGLAIKGYDPVSYFTTGKPTQGLARFSISYKGITYHIASAEHRHRFVEMLQKFLPQYGGY